MSSDPSSGDDGATARLLAFYLPQFHAIPENDAWWGEGFTEWTNVRRAQPLFPGHDQPRVPGELGYYDLEDPSVLDRQAALAREYGIHGFCFYYYWFGGGRRLLEMPLDRLLESGRPDFPFCLCWANEPWTRRWDGQEEHVLMPQGYEPEDIDGFARSVIPFFLDPRYIRVGDRPLLVIYNTRAIPEARDRIERMREIWRAEAGCEVRICSALTFAEEDPGDLGVDAVVGFPPHNVQRVSVDPQSIGMPPAFSGKVNDYLRLVLEEMARPDPALPFYPTVTMEWDNTARRGLGATVFVNGNPLLYGHWLRQAIDRSTAAHPPGERFVFINAWNEWAEGTYLEPDASRGTSYLEATLSALAGRPPGASLLERIISWAPDGGLSPSDLRTLDLLLGGRLAESLRAFAATNQSLAEKLADERRKKEEARQKLTDQRERREADRQRWDAIEGSLAYRFVRPLIKLQTRNSPPTGDGSAEDAEDDGRDAGRDRDSAPRSRGAGSQRKS